MAGEMAMQRAQIAQLARCVEELARGLEKQGPAELASSIAAAVEAPVPGGAEEGGEDKVPEILDRVKGYARGVLDSQTKALSDDLRKQQAASMLEVTEKFAKLEARVLGDVGAAGTDAGAGELGSFRVSSRAADAQVLKKVASRLSDFEAQVATQMTTLQSDLERKITFLSTGEKSAAVGTKEPRFEDVAVDMNAVKYDIGELKDMINNTRSDTAHVKRIVLACERDMEDFTGAMDAVNVDLDEMRARVDSTHSIITSRQRVEATVTAEISTMRLDMGDMQEALKAHDAWMEDVSQSLQECHERVSGLSQDILALRDQTQAKLDGKVDVSGAQETESQLDSAIKTVNNLVSTLRLDVDARRRKVDELLEKQRTSLRSHEERTDRTVNELYAKIAEEDQILHQRVDNANMTHDSLFRSHTDLEKNVEKAFGKIESSSNFLSDGMSSTENRLSTLIDEKFKEASEKLEGAERFQSNNAQEARQRLNAVDLRISGLQGACGEHKREIGKMRDEVNTLMVKGSAHDVDIGKLSDDMKRVERTRVEDAQRHKQDMDAVYEELDQKLYEKNHLTLEDHVSKLSRGVVKLSQVVGVFPGARMDDGTEEELDIDVELLNWEDCCQHMVARVDKMWKQHSGQKYKSVLDLLSKKADHSVLRLLQISQQHIESQLERVRHERELWKEVVDKRAQQPLQLALTLKDQNMLGAVGGGGPPMGGRAPPAGPSPAGAMDQGAQMKTSPLVKRNMQAAPQQKR
jgi:archaellum component FlaC